MVELEKKIKILVVEDDLPLTNLIKKSLNRAGFDVEIALNGEEAISLLSFPNDFTLLIVDYNLPDLTGHEFIIKLAERNLYLPYIVITGSGDIKNAVEMMKLGASDYLIKDINFYSLLPTVVKRISDELITRMRLAQTEIALNKTEEEISLYKSFVEEAGQGFCITELNGNIQYLNPAAIELLKLNVDYSIQKIKYHKFFESEYYIKLEKEILPSVKKNNQWNGEINIINENGDKINTFQNIFLIKDHQNVPIYFASIITDITERKKSEELLKLQSSTLKASANSILITNEKGEIIWINPAFTELTGYTKEELYMKNVNMLNSQMQPKEYYEELWTTINTGKVWRSELINKRKNGELYNEEQTITPVYDKNNNIKNFISIKQDITERKRIEAEIKKINEDLEKIVLDRTQELINTNKALIESENKFRTLFEASGDAIILMDRNKFVDVNNETLNIFGIENKEEFLSLSIKDISPEFQFETIKSEDKIQEILSRIYELGTMKFEWVFKKKDGTEIITDNNLSIIEFKEEKIIQSIIRDITEKKKAENILQETQLRLMEFEKMAALGEMVAGVAHEINTPIGIGVTAASFLDEKTLQIKNMLDKGELKKSEFLNYINVAVNSSSSILINLKRAADLVKSFKQVAVDQSSQELRKFNILEYMDDILLSLRPKLKRTNHIINIECNKDLEIKNYPGAFSQIFTNLIVNSVIHGFDKIDKGTITIEFEISEDDLIIKYSDNGRGIAKSKMNKIYEPFYSTKKKQGGTGLGLNIVYNLITQKLKGSIFCDSIQHSHTTFLIKIPLIK